MKFGEKVRDLRKKNSLTQDELAKCLGVSKRTIIGWERDGRYNDSTYLFFYIYSLSHLCRSQIVACCSPRRGV